MRKQVSLLLIIIIPLLTGCWSQVEINNLAIVMATGIDKMEDGKIHVSLQLAIPRLIGPAAGQGGGGEGGIETKATWVVSEQGETIMDAFRKLQEKLPRQIFFAHSRITIIGEKLARDGVAPVFDFLTRYRESRLGGFILFTKGEAIDILKFSPKFVKSGATVIREEEKAHIGIITTLRDFAYTLSAEGIEPVAARVEIVPSEVKKEEKSEEMNLALKGAAVFHKDKLIGWMNDMETRGVLWLRKEIKTAVVTVNIPKDKGGGKVSLELLRSTTKIKPVLENHKVKIEVDIQMENDLYENTSKLDLSKPESLRFVGKLLEEDINRRLQLALNKVQKQYKSDIFGFGSAVQRQYPKEWKKEFEERWDQEFPKLDVKITTHVTVVRTGLLNKSLMWEEKEFQK